jgi:hypothetical protein
MDVGGQCHALPFYPRKSAFVSIVQEAGLASGPVWMGVEGISPTGILPPYHPVRSESQYLLSYPGP